jgi:hypothetical protein
MVNTFKFTPLRNNIRVEVLLTRPILASNDLRTKLPQMALMRFTLDQRAPKMGLASPSSHNQPCIIRRQ